MDRKFRAAIKHGKIKFRNTREAERLKVVAKTRKKRTQKIKHRKLADRWVQDKLPELMEAAASANSTEVLFGEFSVCVDEGIYVEAIIIAEACAKVGLKTDCRFVCGYNDRSRERYRPDYYQHRVYW